MSYKDELKHVSVGQEIVIMGIVHYNDITSGFIMPDSVIVSINGKTTDKIKDYCIRYYLEENS